MKRFISLLMALVLLFSLAACNAETKTPETTVQEAVESFQSADPALMQECFRGELAGLTELFGPEDLEILRLFTDNLDYTIDSVIESEDGPTQVKITVTAVDASKVIVRFLQECMAYTLQFAAAAPEELPDDQEVEDAMMEILKTIALDPENDTVSITVDVELVQEDGHWVIPNEYELGNAVLGGLFHQMEQMGEAFAKTMGIQ